MAVVADICRAILGEGERSAGQDHLVQAALLCRGELDFRGGHKDAVRPLAADRGRCRPFRLAVAEWTLAPGNPPPYWLLWMR